MIGAVIGDIAGSRFEKRSNKSKKFELFTDQCRATDDSVMSIAIAKAILSCEGDPDFLHLGDAAVTCMQELGRQYPYAGYGGRFRHWIYSAIPVPYNSWGNGSAMRVSACGWAARSIEEAVLLSRLVTEVTHNHPEGIKGAEAVTVAIYLARTGVDKEAIHAYIDEHYYKIDFTPDDIRDTYAFDVSCQGSVPEALSAFYVSTDFEDAVRTAVSIGGDSDTIAAITGSIAEAYYDVPDEIRERALTYLDDDLRAVIAAFEGCYPR